MKKQLVFGERRPASSLGCSRRSFVRGLPAGLAGLALGSTLWSRLLGRALAQDNAAQRLLVWYTADGTVPEWFWGSAPGALTIRNDRTTDLSGTDFNQSLPNADRPTFVLQSLAAYADRITLVRGISNPGQGDHAPAVRSMFTGEALSGEDEGASPSLDTVVSEVLTNANHVAPILRTGVYGNRVSYGGTRDVSRTDSGFVEPSWQPTSDARQVLDAVGGLDAPTESGVAGNASRLAILGSVRERVEALRCAGGTPAAQRLEAYVEEVARLEALESDMRPAPGSGLGAPLVDPDDPSFGDAERDIRGLPTIAPFVRDLAVSALALDYAPVTTIQWGASGENKIEGGELTDYRYDFLPDLEYPGAGDHGLAHPEDGAFQDAGHRISAEVSTRDRVRIFSWFFGQLKSMMDRMASIPDGTGTLLDNTTILCVSEFGGPNANSTAAQHSTENLPFVLISGPNSPFRRGQYLEVERSHGDYLLTIARAFGSSIGNVGIGDSVIDELLL
jgi:Protein of unknown function (DUF1552)/Protein of unknown function (DUF1501)